jgi:hypothetical protein
MTLLNIFKTNWYINKYNYFIYSIGLVFEIIIKLLSSILNKMLLTELLEHKI